MPIYEYQCQKCGTFEVTQRITEKSLSKCPTCKNKVKKLISNTSFQLKGTGWYVTDYARKSQGEPKAESKDAASTSTAKDAGGEKSSSDKPAAEKPAKPASPPASSGKTKKS
jgi:putative FmdB family regulatory protein